jgi:hypothetical protein
MSGLTPPLPPAGPVDGSVEKESPLAWALRDALTSVLVVLAWSGAAALIAAVIWWQVTPLAEFTRTADNATMDEEQLAKQFGADGWFIVIAAVAGLASGALLMVLRRRNPILMVLLVAAGGAFATLVMLQVGLALGPSDPSAVLASTSVGAKVPLQLKPDAHGVWFVWSIASLLGAIVALWIAEARAAGRAQHTAAYGAYDARAWSQNQQ